MSDPTPGELLLALRRIERAIASPPPKLLNAVAAAAYCGFGKTKFAELVAAGVLPRGRKVPGKSKADGKPTRVLMWLRADLDHKLERLPRDN